MRKLSETEMYLKTRRLARNEAKLLFLRCAMVDFVVACVKIIKRGIAQS